ncbi:MAG: hypothetical protein IPG22_17005 [Acidobacteria bacterium]|nr:hypothetical protein [Acidobacteriota bacterium]
MKERTVNVQARPVLLWLNPIASAKFPRNYLEVPEVISTRPKDGKGRRSSDEHAGRVFTTPRSMLI